MPLIALLAEFIGTFALVFIGAGSACLGNNSLEGIALAHGLTVAIFASCLGSLSGAHFNPAVSFVMWMRQVIDSKTFGFYVLAQLSASLVAALSLAIACGSAPTELGSPMIHPSISLAQGFWIEMLLTCLFVFVILRCTQTNPSPWAPLAIGGMLTACIMMGGFFTGASLNPARSLGPCILSGSVEHLWIYFTAPMVGAWLGMKVDANLR